MLQHHLRVLLADICIEDTLRRARLSSLVQDNTKYRPPRSRRSVKEEVGRTFAYYSNTNARRQVQVVIAIEHSILGKQEWPGTQFPGWIDKNEGSRALK